MLEYQVILFLCTVATFSWFVSSSAIRWGLQLFLFLLTVSWYGYDLFLKKKPLIRMSCISLHHQSKEDTVEEGNGRYQSIAFPISQLKGSCFCCYMVLCAARCALASSTRILNSPHSSPPQPRTFSTIPLTPTNLTGLGCLGPAHAYQ